MVAAIRSCERMLGDGRKQPQPAELNTLKVARRSLRAGRFIEAGQYFRPDDLICQRPAEGLNPMCYEQILGRRAHRSYQPGEAIDG